MWIAWNESNSSQLKVALIQFGQNPPEEYALAAREGVNNKRERGIRARYIRSIFDQI